MKEDAYMQKRTRSRPNYIMLMISYFIREYISIMKLSKLMFTLFCLLICRSCLDYPYHHPDNVSYIW